MEKPSIRRIVTGKNKDGRSLIVEDSCSNNHILHPLEAYPDLALINLWTMESTPTKISQFVDTRENKMALAPSQKGINFRYVDFPPDTEYLHLLDKKNVDTAWENLDSDQSLVNSKKQPHPLMHETQTVDFGIVLLGEIYLILDNEECLVKQGEVVIQRGTNHAWSNRTKNLCRMAFVLIGAE